MRQPQREMLRTLRQTLPRIPCGGGYTIRTPERKMQLFAVAARSGLRRLFRHDWHRLALEATEEVADAPHRADSTRRVLRDWHREQGEPVHPDNAHLDQAVWSAASPHEFWEATDALLSWVSGGRFRPRRRGIPMVRLPEPSPEVLSGRGPANRRQS